MTASTARAAQGAHTAHADPAGHVAEAAHVADRVERAVSRARFAGRQLWLAGLGAAAAAAGSVPRMAAIAAIAAIAARGRRLVDRLVERGQPLAERRSARIQARLESLSDHAERTIQGARTLLREMAEYETRRLLERLDLATVADLRLLAVHLETLDKKLDDYGRRLAETARTAD